jgi:hypothetical protein
MQQTLNSTHQTLYSQFDRPSQWFLVVVIADYLRSGSSWELLLDLHDPDAVMSEEINEFVISLDSCYRADLWQLLRAIVFDLTTATNPDPSY